MKKEPDCLRVAVSLTKAEFRIAAEQFGTRNSKQFRGQAPGTIELVNFAGAGVGEREKLRFVGDYLFRLVPEEETAGRGREGGAAEDRLQESGAPGFDFNLLPGIAPGKTEAKKHAAPAAVESAEGGVKE